MDAAVSTSVIILSAPKNSFNDKQTHQLGLQSFLEGPLVLASLALPSLYAGSSLVAERAPASLRPRSAQNFVGGPFDCLVEANSLSLY